MPYKNPEEKKAYTLAYKKRQYELDKIRRDSNKEVVADKNRKFRVSNPEYKKNWIADNPTYHKDYYEANKETIRDRDLKKKYGISLADYFQMFQDQNGCCKICGVTQEDLKQVLVVDHCHNTSKVRGLLCSACNTAIGLLKDDIKILEKAIGYLS